MRFFTQMILIAVAAYLLDLFLPWYSVAIAAFLVSVLIQSASNFFAGFLGVGILWFASAWLINADASNSLASRVAAIFPLNNNETLLMLLTALIGALVAGCAAVAGASLRKEKRRY
jgi:hypothetical protein